eukprot:m.241724 g.241724  ORF g.241724 m.241724 type:complete len:694 (-) comp16088_c0_seq38:2741-4822(-)
MSEISEDKLLEVFNGLDVTQKGFLNQKEITLLHDQIDLAPLPDRDLSFDGSGPDSESSSDRERLLDLLTELLEHQNITLSFASFKELFFKALEHKSTVKSSSSEGREHENHSKTSRRDSWRKAREEVLQLRAKLADAKKEQTLLQEAADEQVEQILFEKKASEAKLRSEILVLKIEKDEEINSLKYRLDNHVGGQKAKEGRVSDLQQAKRERDALLKELNDVAEELSTVESKHEAEKARQRCALTSLTEQVENLQEENEVCSQERQNLNTELEDLRELLRKVQDDNDELKAEIVRNSTNSPTRHTTTSLADELSGDFHLNSQINLDQAILKIQELEKEIQKLNALCDGSEKKSVLHELEKLEAEIRKEREKANHATAENDALRHMYKELQSSAISPKAYDKLERTHSQMKSNYEDAKAYAQEMELVKNTLELRVKSLELELLTKRNDASQQRFMAPVAPVIAPSITKEVRRTDQTLTFVKQMQEAHMADVEREILNWKIKMAEKELKREKQKNTRITLQLDQKASEAQDLISQLASIKGRLPSRRTDGLEDRDERKVYHDTTQTKLINDLRQDLISADEIGRMLQDHAEELAEENDGLRVKVGRLQKRLKHQYNCRSPVPDTAKKIDGLLEDFTSARKEKRHRKRSGVSKSLKPDTQSWSNLMVTVPVMGSLASPKRNSNISAHSEDMSSDKR